MPAARRPWAGPRAADPGIRSARLSAGYGGVASVAILAYALPLPAIVDAVALAGVARRRGGAVRPTW